MKTLPLINRFCTEVKSTTSRNGKIAILERWKEEPVVVDFLQIMYDPMITFGVTATSVYHYAEAGTPNDSLMWLLSMLAVRNLTGHEALSYCKGFADGVKRQVLSLSAQEADELLTGIFNKDLKLGIDTGTVNLVIPDLINTFDVALAFDINKSATYMRRVESENYLITRKLDGVRCIAIVDGVNTRFYSRLGREYTSLMRVREALVSILPRGFKGVFDGELCVIDAYGAENFKQAVSEVKRKNEQMKTPHYKVFDLLTLDEFYGKKESPAYSVRLEKARELFKRQETAFLSVLKAVKYTPDNFIKAQAVVAQKGYEGLILRSDTPYRSGRTSDLLKVKKFVDAEYIIEDFVKTTKLMKGLSGTMEPVECLGSVVVRHKGCPVEVGSGFSDALRIDMWRNQDKYLGKQITVKYFEETCDKQGNPSLRFPIFVAFREVIQ